ncbi:uncharacterized protein LOC144472940 isoform X3 [Augochlora pura]
MNDFTSALEWVRELGLIPTEKYCGKHKNKMMYVEVRGRLGRFRCRKMGKYDHWITAAHNTWFERCHLSIEACMIITYGFAWKFSFELMQHECSIVENETVSSETISDRFSFCREVCTLGLDRRYEMEGSIGGPGVIVEIDECKVGRRKFEKGRIREGVWILEETGIGVNRPSYFPCDRHIINKKNTSLSVARKDRNRGSSPFALSFPGIVDN